MYTLADQCFCLPLLFLVCRILLLRTTRSFCARQQIFTMYFHPACVPFSSFFEQCTRFCFFEERRKQRDNVQGYSSQPLSWYPIALSADLAYFWIFLRILLLNLFLWNPFVSLSFTAHLAKENQLNPFSHSTNHRGSIDEQCLQRILPCIISNTVTVVKNRYLQAAKTFHHSDWYSLSPIQTVLYITYF